GSPFVVEADEYAGNFDAYLADVVTLTTIEWDHPDVFADRAATIDAFATWLARVPDATLVANLDDSGVVDLLGELQAQGSRSGPVIAVSAGQPAASHIAGPQSQLWIDRSITATILERNADGTVLEVEGVTATPRRVHLPTAGTHNAIDALVALGGAMAAGTGQGDEAADRLLWALASFPGIGRRLERKGEARGVVVYDDYG